MSKQKIELEQGRAASHPVILALISAVFIALITAASLLALPTGSAPNALDETYGAYSR